jgi:hypothetical protein
MNYDGTLKQELPEPGERSKDYRPPFCNYIILPEDTANLDWQKALFEVATLVDTSLFRAYMLARPALAGSLFRLDNFCDPDVVNAKLYESGRYGDLIDFLHGKKLHREALEVLAKFGKEETTEEVAADLRGPQRTVGYLQQLPPELIDLILEFAEWPIKEDADQGMQVFLADTENAETLPRHRVLDFLYNIDSKLAVTYLEHIIYELDDTTPDFHQKLLDLYLERLHSEDAGFEDEDARLQYRARLERLLRSSGQYNRARALARLPNSGRTPSFSCFHARKLIKLIIDPELWESRAIVLSKMDNHKQALQIYVFQIKDYQKAEDYCNQIYLQDSTTPTNASTTPNLAPPSTGEEVEPSIYHTLLSLYLTPPPPNEPNWPPALDLLSKHGARLPASSTLDIIPPTLPIKELESYFRGRIRSANTSLREELVAAKLRGVEKVALEVELMLEVRNRHVTVGEERLCGVCHKRFGGSAVRVYPDGGVVHYGCLRGAGRVGGLGTGTARKGWS